MAGLAQFNWDFVGIQFFKWSQLLQMGPWRCLAFQCIGNPQVCFQCPQTKGFLCFHGGRLNKESKAERALLGHLSVHSGGTATQHFTFSHSVQTAGYSKLEPSLGKRNLMVIMNYRRVKVAVHCQGLRWCPVGSQTRFLLIFLEALQKRRHDSTFYSRILLGWWPLPPLSICY